MRAFFEKVVNHQKLIITFFVLMALVSGVCSTMVGVNYDMKDYLPEDSPSSVALDVMEENFDEAIPNARVMIKNVSVPEALTYKERLAACEGVSTEDLRSTITADMKKVNFIAIGAVFVVLLFTMQSISLPVILVMAIETAIWMNLSIPYFAGNNVFYIAYLIISSIQLGATVDYAILFTDRYMEETQQKPQRGHSCHCGCRYSIGTHFGERAHSGRLPFGQFLNPRYFSAARHVSCLGRALVADDCALCAAGSALSFRWRYSSHHPRRAPHQRVTTGGSIK